MRRLTRAMAYRRHSLCAAILLLIAAHFSSGLAAAAQRANQDRARLGTVEHWEGYIDSSVVIAFDLMTDGSTWSANVTVPALAGAEITASDVEISDEMPGEPDDRMFFATVTCGPWGRVELSSLGTRTVLTGSVTIRNETYDLHLRRVPPGLPAGPLKAWEPDRPLGYRAEEVAVRSGALTIAGELTVPDGEGAHPGLVLLGGSEAADRDGNEFTGHGKSHYRYIAHQLTRRGFAVLRTDDRGVGGSTGERDAATLGDLAVDAIAAVEYLAARDDVRPGRIGLVGYSEGASVAPIVATKTPAVSHVVLLAPEAVVGAVGILDHWRQDAARAKEGSKEAAEQKQKVEAADAAYELLLEGVEPPEIGRQLLATGRFSKEAIDRVIRPISSAKARFRLRHDPAPLLSKLTVPALAVYFGKDDVVPLYLNEPALREAIARGRRSNFTVKVFPEFGHGMRPPPGDGDQPLPAPRPIPELEVLAYVSNWLLAHEGGPDEPQRDARSVPPPQ